MRTLCVLLLALASVSGSSARAQSSSVRLGPVSVVATSSPGFRLFPGVSVSLRDEAARIYQDPRIADESLEALFRETVMSGLVARGYRLAPPGESTYEVGFVLALSAEMDNARLIEELGFSPGLDSADNDRFERGTLAVLLFEPGSNAVMWRGAIQAFTDLEADPAIRAERVRLATRRLLRALPQPPS